MSFLEKHNEVFNFLLRLKETDYPELRYRLRRTNRSNKLRQGYYFLGTDDYIAIGFWEGMNWKTRIPNIAFILEPSGKNYFRFDTSDSWVKTKFIQDWVINDLISSSEIRQSNFLNHKVEDYQNHDDYIDEIGMTKKMASNFDIDIEEGNYQSNLLQFLATKWTYLNDTIEVNQPSLAESKLPISIIDRRTFEKDMSKVFEYKESRERLENRLKKDTPKKIESFEINNYGPIKNCSVENIPSNNQWIFITGENGVGKTSILRALGITIGHRALSKVELKENQRFRVNLKFHTQNGESFEITRQMNDTAHRVKPFTVGFAAYGPIRLNPLYNTMSPNKLKRAKGKTKRFDSLFEIDGFLLDLESEFKEWEKSNSELFELRKPAIEELLQESLLNVRIVEFQHHDNRDSIPFTLFHEQGFDDSLLDPVGIEKIVFRI